MLFKNLLLREKWWKIPIRLMLDDLTALKGLLSGDAGYFWAIIKSQFAFFRWLLFAPKNEGMKRKSMKEMKGVYKGSIVGQYFINNKKTFSEIVLQE